MLLSFSVKFDLINEFLDHWSARYPELDKDDKLYTKFVGRPLTEETRKNLYEWKNGQKLSRVKMKNVEYNYLLEIEKSCLKGRYLNPSDKRGGAIWNIFYMHCIEPDNWPIFDQHTYRAMHFMKNGRIQEIPTASAKILHIYEHEYVPFFHAIDACSRKVDRALMAFGQFLKLFDERSGLKEMVSAC